MDKDWPLTDDSVEIENTKKGIDNHTLKPVLCQLMRNVPVAATFLDDQRLSSLGHLIQLFLSALGLSVHQPWQFQVPVSHQELTPFPEGSAKRCSYGIFLAHTFAADMVSSSISATG